MGESTFQVGSRGSRLALVQARDALDRITALFPEVRFEVVPVDTPGDRDLTTDLRASPADFFTRDLDEAVRTGRVDLAIHSAKDLPDPVARDLDWFWLPWREDPRDAWVLPPGRALSELPDAPVVGISSARREAYCRARFPGAVLKPIRGTIPSRLEQLDAGAYDAVLMAGAALNRLGLEGRVTEWVPLSELPVPAGQGALAVTFRAGDPFWTRLRAYFVKAVRFVGAGVGSADYCTWGGVRELRQAEVCLYDVLMDDALLEHLPPEAERVFVGKRCGEHSVTQPEITVLIADWVRRGRRVVRLKGGDPGLFGRLAEETDELDRLGLPYRVRAGVSALTVATTGTGLLLTRRGVSRGFSVLTPRAEGGAVAGVALEVRQRLPLVLFMSVRVASDMAGQLLAEGWPGATPAALVSHAGAEDESVLRTTLEGMRDGAFSGVSAEAPGLLVIGQVAAGAYRRDCGALGACRVLLTCSEALQEKACLRVLDHGGVPLPRPLIRLTPCAEAAAAVAGAASYDWAVLTSPSAVQLFMRLVREQGVDLRRLPRMMACGPGSVAAFESLGIRPELSPPMDYSAEGLARVLGERSFEGQRVLRLRSEKAGPLLAEVLRGRGARVDDVRLYTNEPVAYERLPEFDAVFFASASAVEVYFGRHGQVSALAGKTVVAIGGPTAQALASFGRLPDVVPAEATVEGAVDALARFRLRA